MNRERWAQVMDIFAAALECAPSDRSAFVRDACAGDADVYAEVSSLLAAHEAAGGSIGTPAIERAEWLARRSEKDWIGRRLGPYRIVAEAGRGGMSQVFKAIRDDSQYEKQVAIKVLKPGFDTESLLRRFKAERQILAQLSHPNIAHLLDGGATEDGEPYFVMEYIEGKPIDVYCDEGKLDIAQRLDLFRQLCSAVHYVHQHLMVHGDLKGANVLVTQHGTVKLLDFGIAKLLQAQPGTTRVEPRATTFLALTPEYASPEQVRGEPITTISDVYSLGVLLYRVLTRELPYQSVGGSTWALAQEICERDPPPPSATAEAADGFHARFAKELRGDLDNIVLKALKKSPEERYTSAEQLADDLRRYLRGFPVLARADTTGYRVRKFAQRHKAAAVAAGLFVVALVTGIITTTWQAREARVERARAERHFNGVRELTAVYLADVYDSIAKLPGGTAARKLLVENSIKYLAALEQEARDSPALQRDLALAYERLGDVQGNFTGAATGDTSGAIESYQRSLNIRRELVAKYPTLDAQRDFVRAAINLSELSSELNDTQLALKLAEEAVQVAESIMRNPQATRGDRKMAAAAYMTWGWEQGLLGATEASMKSLTQAREIYRAIAAEYPNDRDAQRDLVVVAGRTGNVYLDKMPFEPDKAVVHYEEALQLIESLVASMPDDAELLRMHALVNGTLAGVYNELGEPRKALPYSNQSLATIERLHAADEADHMALATIAYVLNYRAESYLMLGEHMQALADLTRAKELIDATSDDLLHVASIQLLPGLLYAKLAKLEGAFASGATAVRVRAEHVRNAREWSARAREVLEAVVDEPINGWRARRELEDLEKAMQALPTG